MVAEQFAAAFPLARGLGTTPAQSREGRPVPVARSPRGRTVAGTWSTRWYSAVGLGTAFVGIEMATVWTPNESRATRKLPGGPACHRNSYRYLPISFRRSPAPLPPDWGHSAVWRRRNQMTRRCGVLSLYGTNSHRHCCRQNHRLGELPQRVPAHARVSRFLRTQYGCVDRLHDVRGRRCGWSHNRYGATG